MSSTRNSRCLLKTLQGDPSRCAKPPVDFAQRDGSPYIPLVKSWSLHSPGSPETFTKSTIPSKIRLSDDI